MGRFERQCRHCDERIMHNGQGWWIHIVKLTRTCAANINRGVHEVPHALPAGKKRGLGK